MTAEHPIVAFLKARLNEDEQWALAASQPSPHAKDNPPIPAEGLHWRWGVGPNWEPTELDPATQEFVGEDEGAGCTLISVEEWPTGNSYMLPRRYATVEEMDVPAAGHIVRHDPARVLREVEAKRRILARHQPRSLDRWVLCSNCRPVDPDYPSDLTSVVWPCPDLRDLAASFSDHSEYAALGI